MAYKHTSSASLFYKEYTLEELSTIGNPLSRLKEILDFGQFRQILEPVFAKENRKSDAGRRPFASVLMMNSREFLGIENVDDMLDEHTVCKYKDMPARTGTWDGLFARFTEYLDTLGLIVTEGKIIDASFVIAPRQRNSRETNNWTKGWQGRVAMARPASQEMPQGRGCPMGEEPRRDPFWIQ